MTGRPASQRGRRQQAYVKAIGKRVDDPPHVEILVKLGQVLARDQRQVTPAIMRPMMQLLFDLYAGGCSSGVLQDMKMRHAFMAKLQDGAQLGGLGSQGVCVRCHQAPQGLRRQSASLLQGEDRRLEMQEVSFVWRVPQEHEWRRLPDDGAGLRGLEH